MERTTYTKALWWPAAQQVQRPEIKASVSRVKEMMKSVVVDEARERAKGQTKGTL